MDIHPLIEQLGRCIHVLLDQSLDHRHLVVSAHARLLEVLNMHVPAVNHVFAAGIAPTRKAAFEIPQDDGELGVKGCRERVCIGVAAAAHEGDLEHDFASGVVIDGPVKV